MVLKKISKNIAKYKFRSCNMKRGLSLFEAYIRKFKYNYFKKLNVNIYKCSFCGMYHVGHAPTKKSKYKIKNTWGYNLRLTLLGK